MFLQDTTNILPGQNVKIKYDCNGGFDRCGKEVLIKLKYATKNFNDNNGKHICRQCILTTNNPGNKPGAREKQKATTLEKYGVTCALNTPENIKERNEQMFGTQKTIDARTEKTRETMQERFGADHIMQTEEGKNKQRKTMQEKYGVDYPLQNPEIMDKMQTTVRENYGVDNVMQIKEVREKQEATTEERFGVKHYNELPEMKDYLREACKEWLADSWANPWAKGIKRPKEWNDKQRQTVKKRIQEGTWSGGYVSNFRGKFPAIKCKKENPRFLSILEAKFHYFLNFNPLVEWYNYEDLIIKYFKIDKTEHDYYVDFQVKYLDDPIQHNYELKAWKNKDNLDVKAKYEAAINYCNKNNMTYMLLFEEDIDKLNITDTFIKNFPNIILY